MKVKSNGRVYDYPHYDAEERAKKALKRHGYLVRNAAGRWSCGLGSQFQHRTICKLVVAGSVAISVDGNKAVLK